MMRNLEQNSSPAPSTSAVGLHNMIKVKTSHLKYFYETPLYFTSNGISFETYKPSHMSIKDTRLRRERLPLNLYIHAKDKHLSLKELQKGLNVQLKEDLRSDNPLKVKNTLINLVHETLKAPSSGGIEGAASTVDIVFSEYLMNQSVINRLISVVSTDYTTAIHSVNVMVLTLRFCFFSGMSEENTKKLGLSALLHDVGKIKINSRILKSNRKLKDSEFELMKMHTVFGHEILQNCALSEDICLVALHHHERTDGSGYPDGITDISQEAEIIGFIDCFEALTTNERPYREAISPFYALKHIKKELFKGSFNSKVYERFVKSLG